MSMMQTSLHTSVVLESDGSPHGFVGCNPEIDGHAATV